MTDLASPDPRPQRPALPGLAAAVASLPVLIPLVEFAAFLRITPRTARRWMRSGRIRYLRAVPRGSSRVYIPRRELERLLEEMERPCAEQGGPKA